MNVDTIIDEYTKLSKRELAAEKLDDALADLMIRMEKHYNIPDVLTEEWQEQNKPVSTAYRILASARLMTS